MRGQRSWDDLSTPLVDVPFVVVDLETTGGSPTDDAVTEIGAVRVRGGEILGEFHTLVSPGRPIPDPITRLTGISDATVAGAPTFEAVLPAFLEFASGAVLVAHNAGFDIGFLKAAAARQHLAWPSFAVIDTVKVARAVLGRRETPNVRLATLAGYFGSPVSPTHRALDDARATVHVLHGLLERVGTLGVHDLDDLAGLARAVPEAVRRKTVLADGLPDAPGVYLFKDDAGRVLYVGTSRSLRTRVRSYFTASEQRSRVRQMVRLATEVVPIVCPTPVEAQVREVRLIAQHRPPYNRRSRDPERTVWLRLTDEPFPRVSIARAPRGGDAALGPFAGRAAAQSAAAALLRAVPLRTCTPRLRLAQDSPACVLADLGRCGAPCDGRQSRSEYAVLVERARHLMVQDPRPVVDAVERRLERLTARRRFEEAAVLRDGVAAYLRGFQDAARLRALSALPLLAAAAPAASAAPAWELIVLRHGVFVASATVPHGPRLRPALDALIATAPTVNPDGSGLPVGHVDEARAVLAWLDRPRVRPAVVDGTWVLPVGTGVGSDRYRRAWLASIQRSSNRAAEPSSMAAAAR
jgi:DNA polymerase-3 subunit epsilon